MRGSSTSKIINSEGRLNTPLKTLVCDLQFKVFGLGPPHLDTGGASRSDLRRFDSKDEPADGDGDDRPHKA